MTVRVFILEVSSFIDCATQEQRKQFRLRKQHSESRAEWSRRIRKGVSFFRWGVFRRTWKCCFVLYNELELVVCSTYSTDSSCFLFDLCMRSLSDLDYYSTEAFSITITGGPPRTGLFAIVSLEWRVGSSSADNCKRRPHFSA